ncbi:MAG TPA: hypothetical protein VIF61_12365 [Methylocystis sp.]
MRDAGAAGGALAGGVSLAGACGRGCGVLNRFGGSGLGGCGGGAAGGLGGARRGSSSLRGS